jgi:hypothetical protein
VTLFPISGDPQIIAAAIQREQVRYLVVNDRPEDDYFLPREDERYERLQAAFPGMLDLVHAGPGYRVYEVPRTR